MSLPFVIDPDPTPRKVTVQIYADPDINLSGFCRMYHRWTQDELAAHVGCSSETIQDIERGTVAVSRKMGRRLLATLPRRVQLEWLGLPHRYGR